MSSVREKEAGGCEGQRGGGSLELPGVLPGKRHLRGLPVKLDVGFLITVCQAAPGAPACPEGGAPFSPPEMPPSCREKRVVAGISHVGF